jgi:hypothetical protein
MSIPIRRIELKEQTNFVPLGVLGYCLTRTDYFDPVFLEMQLPLKTVRYAPRDKLLDILVSILAGCRSIAQVNTRIRPDLVLAEAWNRTRFAEQSSLMRTLDVFDDMGLTQLRRGSEALFRRESRTLAHDFDRDWLWLDIDLTPLPISKHAEGSSKGHMGEKTQPDGSWLGYTLRNTRKRFSLSSIPAIPTVVLPIPQSYKVQTAFYTLPQRKKLVQSYGVF